MSSTLQKNIDLLLLACGSFIGLVTPLTILSRATNGDLATADLVRFMLERPLQGVPAAFFAVAGFTLVSVGLNGIRGKYANVAERQEAIASTAGVCTIICVGACSVLYGLSQISLWVEYRDVRIAATIVGALAGYQLVSSFPSIGNDQTIAAFTGAGALLGYCAAPLFVLFVMVAGCLFVGVPLMSAAIGKYWAGQQQLTDIPSHSATAISRDDKQINDLRQKIQWVKNQGHLPPHLIHEEVARLQQQIKSLGGTP